MNPFHSPTASRAELSSYYVLLALQIPVHRIGDHTGGMAVKLDGTREPRHTRLDRDLRGIDRERICRADRVVGFLLQRIDDQWTSCSRVEVPVVHLDRAYSRARLVGTAWTSPFELICNVRRVPRPDAVCGDRIEAQGDRNMLGYAARVATRFDAGFDTRAPSTALRDHSILPTETLDIVVTADKLDIPTVYRRTSIADKAVV